MDQSVVSDNSKLSRIDCWFYKFESQLALLSGVIIFLLVLLAVINVLGRWLFDAPVDGYIDWVEQSMAFFAFLGIAFVQRNGGHIRMDMLVAKLKKRKLWISELVSSVLMLIITIILSYGSYFHFIRAYELGDSSLDINLPTWPAKLVVPIAFGVLIIRLIIQIIIYLKAIKNNEEFPAGVPLVDDAMTTAKKSI